MTTSSGSPSFTPNGLFALPVFAGPWLELSLPPPLVAQADSAPAAGTARNAVRPIPRSMFRRERSEASALPPMGSDMCFSLLLRWDAKKSGDCGAEQFVLRLPQGEDQGAFQHRLGGEHRQPHRG